MAVDFLQPGVQAAPFEEEQATFSWADQYQKLSYAGLIGLVALLIYSYWDMLTYVAEFWEKDQYSHGYIIPLIALYLMWSRRPNPTAQEPPRGQAEETFFGLMPASLFGKSVAGAGAAITGLGWQMQNYPLEGIGWAILCLGGLAYVMIGQPFSKVGDATRYAGLGIVLLGFAARFVAGEYEIEPINRYSFLICLFGVVVLVGGWRLAAWAGPAVGFLFFMYPLPSMIERPLLMNMQLIAAVFSEIALVILGQPVVRQGAVINVDGIPLEVATACSGMRMLTIFIGLSVALVLLMKRPWWDRFTILLTAIPIAIFVNVIRIVLISLTYRVTENEVVREVMHNQGGLSMIFFAMGLLYLLQALLDRLTVAEDGIDGQPMGVGPLAT
ncbi:MAG: exosortase/archaeosortase family protein [Planctomycetota bacterium]